MTALALGVSSHATPSLAQGPVDVAPAAETFKVGAMQVSVLRTGRLAIPNDGSAFGTNATPAEVASVLKAAGQPTDTIYLDIDVLLVRTNGRVVLLDTGLGVKNKSVLDSSLAMAHVSPGDVTDVLITHAHGDHVGGLVDASGRPAFPHAVIRMSKNEWTFMQRSPDIRAVVSAVRAQVRPFVPGKAVVPGIVAKPLYGHTPGHTIYELSSGGEGLLDLGDAVHSSVVSLARPEWILAWDFDKALGARQRQTELDLLSKSHERVFAVHFPFPGVGYVAGQAHGFAFSPSVPTARPSR